MLGMVPVLGAVIGLLLIYPQVCVYVKRLHDMGKTGWLVLLPLALTFGLLIAAFVVGGASVFAMAGATGSPDAGMLAALGSVAVFLLLILVVNLGFLLWVGLSKGDPDTNQYGPPPQTAVAGAF